MIEKVNDLEPDLNFEKIDVGPKAEDLPEEIVRDLGRDQKLVYKRWRALKLGKLSR